MVDFSILQYLFLIFTIICIFISVGLAPYVPTLLLTAIFISKRERERERERKGEIERDKGRDRERELERERERERERGGEIGYVKHSRERER